MANEVPSGDAVVFAFCELFALAFAFEAVSTFLGGRTLGTVIGCLVLTVLCFFLGIKWPSVKTVLTWKALGTLGNSGRLRTVLAVIFIALGASLALLYHYRYSSYIYNRNVDFQLVLDKSFRSERVHIDGKEFRDCTFNNVTLVYDGTAPVRMIGNRFSGDLIMTTNNPAIGSAEGILSALGFMPETERISDEPLQLKRQLH